MSNKKITKIKKMNNFKIVNNYNIKLIMQKIKH